MLNKDKEQFQIEQDNLLKTVLEYRYFKPWRADSYNEFSLRNDANLEIFVTDACNQNCEYCYLVKYKGLYPQDKHSPENIKTNLRSFYEYLIEQHYHIPKAEFFTGEIWQSQFGLDILQITLDYLDKGLDIGWFLIASNCSFCLDDTQMHRIQHYIDAFQRRGRPLTFSASIDGLYLDEMERPMNNGYVKTQEDYDKIFCFCKHNNYCFHPMVSSQSAKYWIENHKWWESQCDKWGMNIDQLMMLEIRNSDWTKESIKAYQDFMDYLIDRELKRCGNNIKAFTQSLFRYRVNTDTPECEGGYIPWAFPECDSFIGCTCATDFCFRVGDMAIAPCHRTAYNKYLYGHFVTDENNKIIDIEANNPQMAIKVLMSNFNASIHRCDTCPLDEYCLKGCYGAQYEENGDPFIPSDNVCTFFFGKYGHLIDRYEKMGVIDYLREVGPLEEDYEHITKFLKMVKEWHKSVGKGK